MMSVRMNIVDEGGFGEAVDFHENAHNNDFIDHNTNLLLNPILYVRNIPSEFFFLILSGTVVVCSGQEGFFIELGPFNYLGIDALVKPAQEYLPDFSAKVINKARLLKITRDQYQKMLQKFGSNGSY